MCLPSNACISYGLDLPDELTLDAELEWWKTECMQVLARERNTKSLLDAVQLEDKDFPQIFMPFSSLSSWLWGPFLLFAD
jgi:hypothetical protein